MRKVFEPLLEEYSFDMLEYTAIVKTSFEGTTHQHWVLMTRSNWLQVQDMLSLTVRPVFWCLKSLPRLISYTTQHVRWGGFEFTCSSMFADS